MYMAREDLGVLRQKITLKTDDELEALYRQCLQHEMKKEVSDGFVRLLNDFETETTPKAGFAILERFVGGEIARRWRVQREALKQIKNLFN